MTKKPRRPPLIAPDTYTDADRQRVRAMDADLTFLLTVNWCDIDRRLQIRVLMLAMTKLLEAELGK
jgi:hypothetical protein